MTLDSSGRIFDNDGDMIGFYITLDDYILLDHELTQLAGDLSTQPAYARGLFRALGAFNRVLTRGKSPRSALANPSHTVDWLNQIRAKNRQYQ